MPIRIPEISASDVDEIRAAIDASVAPFIVRGAVASWPVVAVAKDGTGALCSFLRERSADLPVEVLEGAPEIDGKFFYRDDMRGVNFSRSERPVGSALSDIESAIGARSRRALYIQSALARKYFPGFEGDHPAPYVGSQVEPRMWIGTALTVHTHFDLAQNIACVVAGRKRFTLFPPDQISNMYPGPLELTLSGPPVSMAPITGGDARYPKFSDALQHALVGDLSPGDMIYIPYHWWHHVESIDAMNVLVNYWWGGARDGDLSPRDCFLHALLVIRALPAEQRAAWKAVFDYFIFETSGDPVAHLPEHVRGVLGAPTPALKARMKAMLFGALGASLPKSPIEAGRSGSQTGDDHGTR